MKIMSKKTHLIRTSMLGVLFSCSLQSALADTFYCTQNNQYINTGMTVLQVQSACGAPQNVTKSQQSQTQQIPVSQLTFNIPTSAPTTSMGTITTGIQSGTFQVNQGPMTTIVVSVQNDQIKNISLNGQTVQSVSVCGGGSFGVGDPAENATGSCGDPATENDTYMNEPTGGTMDVETWSYQPSNYQPPFQFVFQNGILTQIINSGSSNNSSSSSSGY